MQTLTRDQKRVVWIGVFLTVMCIGIILIVSGCDDTLQTIVDPNSALNQTLDTSAKALPAVQGVATVLMPEFAWLITALGGLFGTLFGTYKNYRTKLQLHKTLISEDAYKHTAIAIVDAIENVSDLPTTSKAGPTIGEFVKSEVKGILVRKHPTYYPVVKGIITGIKEGLKNPE